MYCWIQEGAGTLDLLPTPSLVVERRDAPVEFLLRSVILWLLPSLFWIYTKLFLGLPAPWSFPGTPSVNSRYILFKSDSLASPITFEARSYFLTPLNLCWLLNCFFKPNSKGCPANLSKAALFIGFFTCIPVEPFWFVYTQQPIFKYK